MRTKDAQWYGEGHSSRTDFLALCNAIAYALELASESSLNRLTINCDVDASETFHWLAMSEARDHGLRLGH